MSQLSLAFDPSLLIRDEQGRYLPATTEQILDAARKVIDQKVQRGAAFTSSELVKDHLIAKLGGFEHEVFAALFLDAKHRLIQYVEMFRGTIDSAEVHPREVVKEALRLNAAAVILSHNHPSGNPEPSQADRVLTQRLKEALGLVDVRVLDHVIVAGSATASFAELGISVVDPVATSARYVLRARCIRWSRQISTEKLIPSMKNQPYSIMLYPYDVSSPLYSAHIS